MVWHNLITKK